MLDHLEDLLYSHPDDPNADAEMRQKAWERRVEEDPAFTRASND